MKRERRQPTRREWAAITSRSPVVRRIAPPNVKTKPNEDEERLDRIAGEALDAHLERDDEHRRWERGERWKQ